MNLIGLREKVASLFKKSNSKIILCVFIPAYGEESMKIGHYMPVL